MQLETQGCCRKPRRALASTFVQLFLQQHTPLWLQTGNPSGPNQIKTPHGPVWAPQGTGHFTGIHRLTHSALNDVIPGLAPAHQPGFVPQDTVVGMSQYDQLSTAARPCLQRFNDHSFAQGPILKVGVTPDHAGPTLLGRAYQSTPNQFGKLGGTAERPGI